MGADQSTASIIDDPSGSGIQHQRSPLFRTHTVAAEQASSSTGGIVTVASAARRASLGSADTAKVKDIDLKRLNDIPVCFPIYRNNLNIPGLRDAPDLASKIGHHPLSNYMQRLQLLLSASARRTSETQNAMGKRLQKIDEAISVLSQHLMQRQKRFANATTEIAKIREISSQLRRIDSQLPDLVLGIRQLNNQLPPTLRLSELSLDPAQVILKNDSSSVRKKNTKARLLSAGSSSSGPSAAVALSSSVPKNSGFHPNSVKETPVIDASVNKLQAGKK